MFRILANILVAVKMISHITIKSTSTLREKSPYSELFRSAFSRIWAEYREILRISAFSVRMLQNTGQNNSVTFYTVQLALIRVNLKRIKTKDIAFTCHSQWTIFNLNICFRRSLRFHLPVVGLFIYFERLLKHLP